ncbi:putative RNA helicase [Rosa chinensis]|uniref:Putative RNA helicase n=1 Tax=Rosa chinensis TaxID=74649 RepID=A0A2P6RHC9_ROSCH|nr:putative RNA helicase [Rosa chinensis]
MCPIVWCSALSAVICFLDIICWCLCELFVPQFVLEDPTILKPWRGWDSILIAMATTATASAGPRYAPEEPWKGLVDCKTGYLYFWNPETNVTQYDRPTSLAPPSKGSSAQYLSSSVQVQ